MYKAYKYRIYPNKAQTELINKSIDCARFVYNKTLEMRQKAWERRGERLTPFDLMKRLPHMKEYLPFLKEVDSVCLKEAIKDMDSAYQNWWKALKRGDMNHGAPRFKSKRNASQSFRTCSKTVACLSDRALRFPKLGQIHAHVSRQPVGEIIYATISRTPSGKYFASLLCRAPDVEHLPENENAIGIDVGIRNFATDSEGTVYANEKYFEKAAKKLRREQKRLSRMVKGSANWEKQRIRVARAYEKMTNQRRDHHQKLSTQLIRENQTICVETLDIQKMAQKSYMARDIYDAAWYEFVSMLEYKANWYGRNLVKVDKKFPSTRTCSSCGAVLQKKLSPHKRTWICPSCGVEHDRCLNSAKNILAEGVRMMNEAEEKEEKTA